MSYGGRLRSRQDIYWPAFVDIFVVLLAASLLAIPPKKPSHVPCSPPYQCVPPGSICSPPNQCAPSIITPMRSEQFLAKRLSCRLNIASGELRPTLSNVTASGDSIRVKVPVENGGKLSEEVKGIVDHVKNTVFGSGLRSRWRNEPILSLEITGVAVQFVSGPEDQATSASYASRLRDHISSSLATLSEPVPVTWFGTVQMSMSRPQLFIGISTVLTKHARDQAEAERLRGLVPCPSSLK